MNFLQTEIPRIDAIKKLYQTFGVTVNVLRLDLVHPVISGNKWFKLKEYLKDAGQENKKTILTFGGAYSNHIIATAAACKEAGFNSIGIIRGEKPKEFSPTLEDAQTAGMHLFFCSRDDYKSKIIPQTIWQQFAQNDIYIINEGGYGEKGKEGAANILDLRTKEYTHIIAATGTGTTLAGIVSAANPGQKITGISALKNYNQLNEEINALLPHCLHNQYTIYHDYHFGGYAKHNTELINFMNNWYNETGIPSDFVYTGKLFYAANDLIQKEFFLPGSNILIIHSGGLQGNRSLPKGTLMY